MYLSSKLDSPLFKTLERENLILMINMLKKVLNWSEVHFSEMTCYKIHTLKAQVETDTLHSPTYLSVKNIYSLVDPLK